MNSTQAHNLRAMQPGASAPARCFVCRDSIEDHCFCKIHRTETETIMLCSPSCTIRYVDSSLAPDGSLEQEQRSYEKDFRLFVGEEKPLAPVQSSRRWDVNPL